MKSVGLITEYNPFHNGHLYHLNKAKEETNADVAIVVMSGNFLQRGEPALVSKQKRAKMAILAGADLVIELPYAFSTQQAKYFAKGAVSLLNELHCHTICFGSENGLIEPFLQTTAFIEQHTDEYHALIRSFIQTGMNYPSALSAAFHQLQPGYEMVDLTQPNNILGYHYIEAANELNDSFNFFTIKRKSADYHQEELNDSTIASATAIRKALLEKNDLSLIRNFVPTSTYKLLNEANHYHHWENYWPLLQYKIISTGTDQLNNIYEMEEGLEFRFKQAVETAYSFEQFIDTVKTKRYTRNRLQRICTHLLVHVTKEEMWQEMRAPQFIRVLGMNQLGRQYLHSVKKQLSLPLITKASELQKRNHTLDVRATNVYSLINRPHIQKQVLDEEYKQPIFYLQ